MRSTITVLAWDKQHGHYKTTVVVDHVVRWVSVFEIDPGLWAQIADHDKDFFHEHEADGKQPGTGLLLSNGEHLILKMPVEDWEQLFHQSEPNDAAQRFYKERFNAS